MYKLIVAFLATFVMFFLSVAFSYAGPLQVTGFSPAPNYSLTTDPQDMQQLTDGITFPSYLWSHIEAVGWVKKHRIAIDISNTATNTGKFSIHVGKRGQSGVHIPYRIDIYGSSDGGATYFHLAGQQFNDSDFPGDDGSSLVGASSWLPLPATLAYPKMVVMVAANGDFFMTDEIQWGATGETPAIADPTLLSRATVPADSTNRLIDVFWARDVLPEATRTGWSAFNGVVAWINPAWENITRYPTIEYIQAQQTSSSVLNFYSLPQDKGSACVGLLNPTFNDITVQVSRDSKALALGQLRPILAGNGTIVHDPIVPLDSMGTITLKANQATYLWVTADMSKLTSSAAGTALVISNLTSGEVKMRIPVTMERVYTNYSAPPPLSTNWGYALEWPSTPSPIWSNPQKALNDERSHGVNVYVISPASIPAVGGLTDPYRIQRLTDEVNLYKGKGRILLYTAWSSNRPASTNNPDLIAWADWMNSFMARQGLTNQDWAIYPVDEPSGDPLSDKTGLGYLNNVATTIKATYPQIQFYADPVWPLSVSQLIPLSGLIDLWQPIYELFVGGLPGTDSPEAFKTFFNGTGKPWWVYHNPTSPAKAESPLNHYLLMGWRAFLIGAQGAGFWSYSDIQYNPDQPSSAWNDFDSDEPDWAVVYEGPNGPITSRRWEAYRQGLQDYSLMKTVRNAGGSSTLPTATPTNDYGVKASRTNLLNYLKTLY